MNCSLLPDIVEVHLPFTNAALSLGTIRGEVAVAFISYILYTRGILHEPYELLSTKLRPTNLQGRLSNVDRMEEKLYRQLTSMLSGVQIRETIRLPGSTFTSSALHVTSISDQVVAKAVRDDDISNESHHVEDNRDDVTDDVANDFTNDVDDVPSSVVNIKASSNASIKIRSKKKCRTLLVKVFSSESSSSDINNNNNNNNNGDNKNISADSSEGNSSRNGVWLVSKKGLKALRR